MPAAHERGEDELDLVSLAVDDRLDVVEEAVGDLGGGSQLVSSQNDLRYKGRAGPWRLVVGY
jgi:hypothetical protein